jgi:quercetin dioxygenase-like cupin family protein
MGKTNDRPDRTGRVLHGIMETFDFDKTVSWVRNETAYTHKGHNALTLVKSKDLRLVLVCLQEGAKLDEHAAPGAFTLTVLEGRINFILNLDGVSNPTELAAGQLLVLEEPHRHAVEALETSAFLLTIVPDSAKSV